ncbi:MAG: M48 family metallopeptidase, partial [Chloroflexota bacterium]
LFFVDLALSGAVLVALILTGLSSGAGNMLAWAPRPLAAVVYFTMIATGYSVVTLPLSYYRGFAMPHRYGLVTQGLRSWLLERAKRGLLAVLLGAGMVAFAYWAMENSPGVWWLLTGALALLVAVALNILAPVAILPLFFKVVPLDDAEMSQRLMGLAHRAGTEVFGVFTIDESTKGTTVNAMLIGLGKTRRIVLSDGLFNSYSPDEVEVIMAHELGHHLHHDVPRIMLLQSALGLVGFYLTHLVLRTLSGPLGFQGISDVATLPLLILTLGAFFTLAGPFTSAYIRRLEGIADGWALRLTGNAAAFVRVMTKLANQNLSEADPSRLAEFLFYDHPPYHRRVEMARSFGRGQGGGATQC